MIIMRGMLLLLLAFATILIIATNVKSQVILIDEEKLKECLPRIEDMKNITPPPWFLDTNITVYEYKSGFDEFGKQMWALFYIEYYHSGSIECEDLIKGDIYYEQYLQFRVIAHLTSEKCFDYELNEGVYTTKKDYNINKDWYLKEEGAKIYGYREYSSGQNFFIAYRDVNLAVAEEDVYGVQCGAGFYEEIMGYGLYVKFSDTILYTNIDYVYYGEYEMEYEFSLEELIASNEECMQYLASVYNKCFEIIKNNVKNMLEKYLPRYIEIKYEYDFDYGSGKFYTALFGNPFGDPDIEPFPIYNITVEVYEKGAFSGKYYPDLSGVGIYAFERMFNSSYLLSDEGTYRIRLKVQTYDGQYQERTGTSDLLPNDAFIECYVEFEDNGTVNKLTIKKARHCWIDTGEGWEILYSKQGYQERDGSIGFKIKVRSVPAWEKLIKYTVYKFLDDANFYTTVSKASIKFHMGQIDGTPIYYNRSDSADYDPDKNTINMAMLPGDIYTYNSGQFEGLYHEFAHALKEFVYYPADEDVEDYLGGSHQGTCDVTDIYFAFDEGHSEFFESLMVDYVKEKGYIEDIFLAPTDYFITSCHFGKEGDKVEGAIAGLLLNGLYKDYAGTPEKAYGIFAKACELSNKYLKHYPYSVHDVLPFIAAIVPDIEPYLSNWDLIQNNGYCCGSWRHIGDKPLTVDGLFGYPLLVVVDPSSSARVTINVNGEEYVLEEPDSDYGKSDVDEGKACLIFIEPNTKIEADFSQGGGVYIILLDLNGNSMEEILSMKYGWFDDALIEFERDGIRVLKGNVVVRSNSQTIYYAGSKIKIIPHSEFFLAVDNETAQIYVMNGSISLDNGIENKTVENGKKATANNESIEIRKFAEKELDKLWSEFGSALETIGIEKKGGGGGKQPGFEILVAIIAMAIALLFKRKNK